MAIKTIYEFGNDRKKYSFRTSNKNTNAIRLWYKDKDGEFDMYTFSENTLRQNMRAMREEVKYILQEDKCKSSRAEVIRIEFESAMRKHLGLPPLKMETIDKTKRNWLSKLLANY